MVARETGNSFAGCMRPYAVKKAEWETAWRVGLHFRDMAGYSRLCAIVFLALAVVAYLALRPMTIDVHLSVFIKSDPQTAFDVFKHPQNAKKYHPLMKTPGTGIEITHRETLEDGVELLYYTAFEEMNGRIVGLIVNSTVHSDELTLYHEGTDPTGLLLRVAGKWTFEAATVDGVRGTLFTDDTTAKAPWILACIVDLPKHFPDCHDEIVNNVKLLAENEA